MPQLDVVSFFSQIFYLFIILFLYYNIIINYKLKKLYISLRIRVLNFIQQNITNSNDLFFFKLYNKLSNFWYFLSITNYNKNTVKIQYTI
jgi:hypothetical protein